MIKQSIEPKIQRAYKPPTGDGFHYVKCFVTTNMENAGVSPINRLLDRGFEVVEESRQAKGGSFYMRAPEEEVAKTRRQNYDLATAREKTVPTTGKVAQTEVENSSINAPEKLEQILPS